MKGDNISDRLRTFAVQVVQLCRAFPKDVAAGHILRQLIRSATAGGANYEEARGAESRADFIHKVGIANKELREAMYWIQLADEARLVPDEDLRTTLGEANELVAILTSSINTARRREANNEPSGWRVRESWQGFAESRIENRESRTEN